MRLVDDVDLGSRVRRREARTLAKRADVVDAAVGRGIDLDKVERGARVRGHAGAALTARLAVHRPLAVERAIKDPREARLARAARAAQQVRVRDGPAHDRVLKGPGDGLLANHVSEGAGPPAE